MSQAPVGQRSAHNPQCRQTSSSLAMMRPVGSGVETYRSCVGLAAGAFRRLRRSASSPFSVKVMQSIGQMSTHASHSMQRLVVNTVCASQLRQRCASLNAVAGSNRSGWSTRCNDSIGPRTSRQIASARRVGLMPPAARRNNGSPNWARKRVIT